MSLLRTQLIRRHLYVLETVRELILQKVYCVNLHLSTKGTKVDLIDRIVHFIKIGEKTNLAQYPAKSLSNRHDKPALSTEALMLKGSYKNDLKTRLFFKEIIGPHFHFTAFGIDWLKSRWAEANPPTYQEFANMWITEYELRKIYSKTPKKEWAYINFVKGYLSDHKHATRSDILNAWNIERTKHKNLVAQFLKGYL
ncbi:hypothetical protein EDM53_04970 [Rickettsiales endosymbiont of Peranema trichophorum]|uniref:SAP domain-containing protein n=1 Tax=Rickettsiales endosymbiont of Peranema trichophorum TaxID=2486577 RepID=UPI0010230A28|nr:SAP domain-containing protein [Rickettsiales endosymbiont of Peranema trichophorum]RZI45543.1 hypothetical protein EDM53_04970 [Rickettsiales endosymbiont of Peranema trichophorum]